MLTAHCEALGLTLETEFVPFSKSRHKAEKSPSLNWRVTLSRGGRAILQTDYMKGCGHCPASSAASRLVGSPQSISRVECIRKECELGRPCRWMDGMEMAGSYGKPIPGPTVAEFVECLLLDAYCLECGGFDAWCGEFGYNPDSMRDKARYDQCLQTSLAFRSAFTGAEFDALKAVQAGEEA
jgi:hypothetical protein